MNAQKDLSPDQDADWNSLLPQNDINRRRFVVTSLACGFALATQPVMGQTAITTTSAGLICGEQKIPTQDGELPAYVARPNQGDKLPTVLVVQEIFGVHEYIKDICRRLAHMGYLAIAPELFARHGEPRRYESIQTLMSELVARIPDAEVMSDLDACARWAAKNGGDAGRLAITGFCWGGRAAWLYSAHNPELKAAVAWYGRLEGQSNALTPRQAYDVVEQLHAPVLGLYGGLDTGIPPASVAKMREALTRSKSPAAQSSVIILYPDAPHAFHADYRPSYRKAEAENGWQRLSKWLKKYGV